MDDFIRYDIALLDVVVSERDDQDNLMWDTPYNILVMFDKETKSFRAIDYHDMTDDAHDPTYYFSEVPESGKYDSIFEVIKGIADSLAYDKEHITFRKFGIAYMRPRCSYCIHQDFHIRYEDIRRSIEHDEEDYNNGLRKLYFKED